MAAEQIRKGIGVVFCEVQFKDHVEVLRKRHKTFKSVTLRCGATCDMPINTVIASDEVCDKMLKVAYYVLVKYFLRSN